MTPTQRHWILRDILLQCVDHDRKTARERLRLRLVAEVRRGHAMRAVARAFGVHLRTVQRWVNRAAGRRLLQVDLSSRKSGLLAPVRRTPRETEDRILEWRRTLKAHSPLGEFGAVAIRRALTEAKVPDIPGVRTIGRVLCRRGALDANARVRRQPPPRGWYLPDLADGEAELDSFDIVEDLVIKGGTHVNVLNGISLHGGLCVSWPERRITAKLTVKRLLEHWRRFLLPAYCQFDNDTVFQGAHQWPDTFGRVTRLCLTLGVTPVFAPPCETGFQAAIESYNGRWQAKVWRRFVHADLDALRRQSDAFVAAARARAAARIESAPSRRSIPRDWAFDLQRPLGGRVIFLRRSDESGHVHLLGHRFAVCSQWPHRLVRAEVDLTQRRVRFHALRRRDPSDQPLLAELVYETPRQRFIE